MDGFETTKRIRKLSDPKKSKVPIIGTTANIWQSSIKNCLDSGMDDVLGKPATLENILKVIQNVLKKTT